MPAFMTPREASIFACLTDTVVAPEPVLPPVRETDAVAFFDRWLGRMPQLNRIGLRGLLYVIEVAPRFMGFGARMRALDSARRMDYIRAWERSPLPQLRQLGKLMQGFGQLAYYGDDDVMRRIGYDPDERVRRARELRAAEGRP